MDKNVTSSQSHLQTLEIMVLGKTDIFEAKMTASERSIGYSVQFGPGVTQILDNQVTSPKKAKSSNNSCLFDVPGSKLAIQLK